MNLEDTKEIERLLEHHCENYYRCETLTLVNTEEHVMFEKQDICIVSKYLLK